MRKEIAREALLAVLPLLCGACSDSKEVDTSFNAWFNDLQGRMDRGDESWAAVHSGSLDALPIVRIELKRSQAYDFTELQVVFEGGTLATRNGGMADWPSEASGPQSAEVPYHEFARLCWLIETLDLPRSSKEWSVQVSHGEHRNISWTTRAGETVELSDYGFASPATVGALAAAIENTARRLEWTDAVEVGDSSQR